MHTREADEDAESILKAEVPKDRKVRACTHFSPYNMEEPGLETRTDKRLLLLPPSTHANRRYTSIALQTRQILHSAYWITFQTCTSVSPVRYFLFPSPQPKIPPPPRCGDRAKKKQQGTDVSVPCNVLGVITFSSNENTSNLVRRMFAQSPSPRIILETDAPYMVPANIYGSLPSVKGRLPLCHTAMIPWTAEVVAASAGEGWDVDRVLELGKTNAHSVYGI